MLSDTPFGQLPLMTVDGVTISQSFAMARWLAREFDLMGKDSGEAAQVDMIADTVADLLNSEDRSCRNKS